MRRAFARAVVPLLVAGPLLAALLPPAEVMTTAARHARNVPFKDDWGFIPFYVGATQGVLPPAMVWEPVNGHRIVLQRLVHGSLAWATGWDVRYEIVTVHATALLTLAALALLVWRTVWRMAPLLAACLVLGVSLLQFSLAQGTNWTWGVMFGVYLAALAPVLAAVQVARADPGWTAVVRLEACALFGVLAFGSNLVLLALVPALLLVMPPAFSRDRVRQAAAALGAGAVVVAVYFVGWHGPAPAPLGVTPSIADYLRFVVTYAGAGFGVRQPDFALLWGLVTCVAVLVGGAWAWDRAPAHRPALLAWGVLVLHVLGAGALTAYGRIAHGANSALFERYQPTQVLFPIGAAGVLALVIGTLLETRRALGVAALVAIGMALASIAPVRRAAAHAGLLAIRRHHTHLGHGAICLADSGCAAADDACLLKMCWSAKVARTMCSMLEQSKIGPFAP